MSANKRPVTIADLSKFQWLQGAVLSPDHRIAVYAVSNIVSEKSKDSGGKSERTAEAATPTPEEKEYQTLYRVDLQNGDTRQLTQGKSKDSGATFSPDGRTLAFTSDRSGEPQIYLLPMDGGEALPLTGLKQGASNPIWSPDGKHIAFTAGMEHGDKGPPNRATQPYRVTRNVWRFDAIGDLDLAVTHVYVIDVASREIKQLTNGPTIDFGLKWSPNGRKILFGAAMAPDRFDAMLPSLHTVDLNGKVENVLEGWRHIGKAWLPDGERIVFVGEKKGASKAGTHEDLYVYNLETKCLDTRTPTLERSIQGLLSGRAPNLGLYESGDVCVTRDGSAAYARVQDGGRVKICRIALTGKECVEPVVDGDRCCALLDMAEERLLFSADDIAVPADLYVANTDGSGEKRLTRLNQELMTEFEALRHVDLTCKGTDGVDVEGWYVKPTNGAPGPYPSILWVHGGPHFAQGHTFAFDTLLLASAGFGVMFFNHRASTGYGNAFSTGIFADWGNLDFGDLMAGVDKAIAAGLADPDKLGVCGLSGGGNLSCCIVGKTHRFKAAVPQNPLTNWQSFYGVSDVGVEFAVAELGGHPHEIPEIYRKCSPISYAHNCKTPTLLIQCEEDWRVPPEQSEQFYTVLRATGCIAEMQRQPNSSHVGSFAGPLPVRRAHLESQLGWFDKYILSKEQSEPTT